MVILTNFMLDDCTGNTSQSETRSTSCEVFPSITALLLLVLLITTSVSTVSIFHWRRTGGRGIITTGRFRWGHTARTVIVA